MIFHWRLSDSKSRQVSRTILSILAILNNVVLWMVSTRSPPSKSSWPFNNTFSYRAKSTNHNWYNFHLHIPYFFPFYSKIKVLISLFTFSLIPWSAGTAKMTILHIFIFFLIIIRSGLLVKIGLSVCM